MGKSSKLSQAEQDSEKLILTALKTKVTESCYGCGGRVFDVNGNTLLHVINTNNEYTGAGIPVVTVVCEGCGLVSLYSTIQLRKLL